MTHCPCSCYLLQEKSIFFQTLEKKGVEQAWSTHKIQVMLDKPKKVEKTVDKLVPKEYHKYLKVFWKEESERMLIRKPWDHAIELKDIFKPKKGRLIPLLHEEQEEVSAFIDDQLRKGYIQSSKSEQTSPMFLVPKKDGKKWTVQDYHYLNEHMVKNNYPLPLIVQLVDKLQGTKMFTKMDLRWSYNNICIEEGDEEKAAFIHHHGTFEPLVMFFGLCNSPSTFQTIMNEIFTHMEDVVVVYVDNIIIFTKTDDLKKHDEIILEVLCCLEENDLYVKSEKCTFCTTEVNFLGMIVGKDGIKMDQEKVKAILDWPAPLNIKGVRSFLSLANFYQRFIQDYTQVVRPLNDLLKKDVVFEWKEAQQHVLDMLKEKFMTASILAYPDNDCQFCLECDASNYATGAVLSILKEDKCHLVTHHFHYMSPEEWNYPITDKEMLSVIRALEIWRHYLEGAKHKFEVWKDHQNLQ